MSGLKYREGDILDSQESGQYIIVKYIDHTKLHIRFLDTGYETVIQSARISQRTIKDPYRPKLHSIGFFGEGKYKRSYKAYDTWSAMLGRCYNAKHVHYSNYGGLGVSVCNEWHNYQTFANFFEENSGEGLSLDKDILAYPNLGDYTPVNCRFIPIELNNALQGIRKAKGYSKSGNKWLVTCRENGVKKYLGMVTTEKEARSLYVEFKQNYIKRLGQELFSKKLISEEILSAILNLDLHLVDSLHNPAIKGDMAV